MFTSLNKGLSRTKDEKDYPVTYDITDLVIAENYSLSMA